MENIGLRLILLNVFSWLARFFAGPGEFLSLRVQIQLFDERYAIDFVKRGNPSKDLFQSRFTQAGEAFGLRRATNF